MAKKMNRGKKNYKSKKRQRRTISDKQKYGIVKSINYGGYHVFKEKTLFEWSPRVTPGPPAIPNTSSTCFGGYGDTLGMTHALNGILPVLPTSMIFPCAQARSYIALFEWYKISGVKIVIYPNATMKTSAAAPANRKVPTLWYFEDSSRGRVNPADLSEVMTRSRVKYMTLDRPRTIYYEPKPAKLTILDGSGAISFNNEIYTQKNKANNWVATQPISGQEPTYVMHNGLQFGTLNPGSADGEVIPYSLVITTYYEFKGNR